jgi:hypothetical protein
VEVLASQENTDGNGDDVEENEGTDSVMRKYYFYEHITGVDDESSMPSSSMDSHVPDIIQDSSLKRKKMAVEIMTWKRDITSNTTRKVMLKE